MAQLSWPMAAMFAVLLAVANVASATAVPKEGDVSLRDFSFGTAEKLPRLRLHYATLGTPHRDQAGHVTNAVLVLHSTGSSLQQFLGQNFAGELFGPGQPLDSSRYYLIFPDAIGHGQSGKPSDGLRAHFPRYTYEDMVTAQHVLVHDTLGVDHLRLVIGTSMGCMHSWIWAERFPSEMDAIMPLACLPTPVSGRNRMWRDMLIAAIRQDPQWQDGDYRAEPLAALRLAASTMVLAASGTLELQQAGPTKEAADRYLAASTDQLLSTLDANDLLYALDASRDYDATGKLGAIRARVLLVNFADDYINPPELGIAESSIRLVPKGRYVLIPASAQTHGHHTHTWAAVWKSYLQELLADEKHVD